jgi:ketosteroid isomerase-like protein
MNKSRSPFGLVAGFVALILLFAGCTGPPARPGGPEATLPENADAAVAVVDRFQAALIAGDFGTVGALLDPEVVILESGGAEYSAAEYLAAHAKSDAEFLQSAQVEPGRRTARVSGDLAWIASLTEIEIEHEGEPVEIDGAESMILRQGPSGWKIVHIHWSSHARR